MSKKQNYIRFNVSLPESLFDELDEYCCDNSLSRSSAICFSLNRYFKSIKAEKQLHDDMSKLIDMLSGFEKLNRKDLSLTELRELDNIKKLCDSAAPTKYI